MGIDRTSHDPGDLGPRRGERITSDRPTGPLLAAAGLIAWGLVAFGLRVIWAGYRPEADVLAVHLIGGGIASAIVLLAGGAVAVTLSAVGGLMSLARLRRSRWTDRASIAGVVAAGLGLAPLAWVLMTLATH